MPKWSLLLLVLLLACDEARGHIVSLRVPATPPQGGSDNGGSDNGGSDNGGSTATPDEDAGSGSAGMMTAGGAPGVDGGNTAGDPAVAGAGSAGAPVSPSCIPLPPKPWVAVGNPSSLSTTNVHLYNPPLQAVDDNPGSRWSTGVEQAGGEWIEVDFGHPVTLTLLELDHKADRNDATANPDFPAQLLVSMSERTRDFSAPVIADVPGTEDFTMVSFPEPTTGRYLLLQQVGTKGDWWSIHDLTAVCDIPVPSP